MQQKMLRLSFLLIAKPEVNDVGQAVWRCTCNQLPGMYADGASPEHAYQVFEQKLGEGRLSNARENVYDPKTKKVSQVDRTGGGEDTPDAGPADQADEGSGDDGEGDSEDSVSGAAEVDLAERGKGELRAICEERGVYEKGMTKSEMLKALDQDDIDFDGEDDENEASD